MKSDTITCSFVMNRDVYNAFKSIVSRQGENVKGNIVRYMESVIRYDTPNADTILAIKEVERLKYCTYLYVQKRLKDNKKKRL